MSQLTIDQALRMVLRHREAGRPADADGIYRQIVAQISGQAESLHWLGLLACEEGHVDLAIDLIGRAIAVDPAVGGYHSNLGECYRRAGQSDRAIASLRRATELAPGLVQAHFNLGVALKDGGPARRGDPRLPPGDRDPARLCGEAHNGLAAALFDARRADEALASSLRAVQLRPDLPDAHTNLGNALSLKGRVRRGDRRLPDGPIELKPAMAEVAHQPGQRPEGQGAASRRRSAPIGRAIALRPDFAAAHSNLGNALRDNGQLDEAIAAFRRATRAPARLCRGPQQPGQCPPGARAGSTRRSPPAAARSRFGPNSSRPTATWATPSRTRAELDRAIAAYRRAIELKPDYAAAYSNLGVALKDLGRFDEAIAALWPGDRAQARSRRGAQQPRQHTARPGRSRGGDPAPITAPWSCGRAMSPPTRTC